MELVPDLSEQERAEIDTHAVLQALKDLAQSERQIIDVLISWGMAFDDIEGMDDLDESILDVLIRARDEQANPDL